jgi:hypothetical protein
VLFGKGASIPAIMNVEDITIGFKYTVDAVGTNSLEVWTVTKKSQNKRGDWEITAKGNKTPYARTFLAEQIKGIHKTMAKEIISESVEQVGTVMGTPMMIEEITYMPLHARRGRKPSGE